MRISSKVWDNYIRRLRAINDRAARLMSERLTGIDLDALTLETRQELIDYAYALASRYGEASGALACEMYDALAALSGEFLPPAEPATTATYSEVAKAVNGTLKYKNVEMVSGAVGRLVKMTGVDTTMFNAIRDGAEWAWIPRGMTCAFCITLASRGWQDASAKALKGGHAEHIHANCDCTYAIRFNRDTDVSGYEPDKYLRMYMRADPNGSSKSKINAMRREAYADTGVEAIDIE